MRGAQPGGRDINPRVVNMLAKQQFELTRNPANGIICYQNEDGDTLDIQADIIGPVQTAYEGGIFRCKLVIEAGFPQSAPKGFFLTKIFHPNVAPNSGEICVNTLKRDWSPAKWSLKHIFEVIRCLLIVPFPESSLNEEAGREFMEDYDSFCMQAKVYTQIHAKPNAAQRETMQQRQREEEKLNAARQLTTAATATTATLQQENSQKRDSPTRLPQSQDSSNQEVRLQKQLLIQQAEEESKLGVMTPVVSQTQQLPITTMQLKPLSGQSSNSQQTSQVLLQVTNSFARTSQIMEPTIMKVARVDDENQLQCQTGDSVHNSATGISPWKQASNLISQSSIYQQESLASADADAHSSQQSVVLINSSFGKSTQGVPILLQKRPSVLFKKKVETAKQRMERYIRRV